MVGSGERNCHWILPISCCPIARSTVFLIGDESERAQHTIEAKQHFDEKVQDRIGDSKRQSEVEEDFDGLFPSIEEVQEAERDADDDIEPLEPESTKSDADDFTPESMDEYISASVLLPRGEDVVRAKVVGRTHGRDGNPLGVRHSNPILDTREYQVEFPDGSTATYTANVIAVKSTRKVATLPFCKRSPTIRGMVRHCRRMTASLGTAMGSDDVLS